MRSGQDVLQKLRKNKLGKKMNAARNHNIFVKNIPSIYN